jgi:hypothetical protein
VTGDLTAGRSLDDALEILADGDRRDLLLGLLEANPQTVATPDGETDGGRSAGDTDGGVATGDRFDRRVTMHHVHLPKLEDYGFVEWDSDTGEVVRGPCFGEIEPLLELLDEHRDELPEEWL